jgi:hypothetical protein
VWGTCIKYLQSTNLYWWRNSWCKVAHYYKNFTQQPISLPLTLTLPLVWWNINPPMVFHEPIFSWRGNIGGLCFRLCLLRKAPRFHNWMWKNWMNHTNGYYFWWGLMLVSCMCILRFKP